MSEPCPNPKSQAMKGLTCARAALIIERAGVGRAREYRNTCVVNAVVRARDEPFARPPSHGSVHRRSEGPSVAEADGNRTRRRAFAAHRS
jgi:hypothetical protein